MTTNVFSQSMISIEQYLIDNKDGNQQATIAYVAKRCAAVFTQSAKIIGQDTEQKKQLFYKFVTAAAAMRMKAITGTPTEDKIRINEAEIIEMVKIYDDQSNKSYAQTGMYFGGVEEDLTICNALSEKDTKKE